MIDIPRQDPPERPPVRPAVAEPVGELEEMRLAIELGLGDYARKNGFAEVVLGISGGIDSALTAALAVEALGPEHVVCVSMPSRFSSPETRGTPAPSPSRSAPGISRSPSTRLWTRSAQP